MCRFVNKLLRRKRSKHPRLWLDPGRPNSVLRKRKEAYCLRVVVWAADKKEAAAQNARKQEGFFFKFEFTPSDT